MGFEDFLKEILKGASQRMEQPQAPGPKPPPPPAEEGGLSGIMRGVVQIVALRQGFMGGMQSAWTGSGTIIDPSGIVLTNCHVANPRAMGMSAPPADRLGIALTDRSDDAPAITYFAELVVHSANLDLAVLRIVQDVHGRAAHNLNLPCVEIGDSDTLQLGDRISILGYPGIGGETVTFTAGNVSGFTREDGINAHRAWIKTDATIAGGNSGGTAVNDDGQLIGIPTQAAAGRGITPVDARPVLDTNRDGVVDERDTPMAIGGFINGLRPVNLAYPLLEKAGVRIEVQAPGRVRRQTLPTPPSREASSSAGATRRAPTLPAGQPTFTELLFSSRITSDGRPINPTVRFPSDIDTVYATFQYDAMPDGTPWSVVWMSNGKAIIEQEDRWDDGVRGRKTVKISNRKGLPEDEYHLVLGIGGTVALEGKIFVGTPADETDSEISGVLVDGDSGRPIQGGIVLVLAPKASLREFLRSQDPSLVFTQTETSTDGSFTFPKQLPKGQAYSLVAIARGFQPVAVEGALRISTAAPENAHLGNIEMARA